MHPFRFARALMILAALAGSARSEWKAPASYEVALKGPPFSLAVLRDPDWVVASQAGGARGANGSMEPFGLAVLHRKNDRYRVDHYVATGGVTTEICQSRDGQFLIAVGQSGVDLFKVAALIHPTTEGGKAPTFGQKLTGAIYCMTSQDDRLLFVSEEGAARIAVFDFPSILAHGFSKAAALGTIPTGRAPVGLVISPDNRWLYSTSEVALSEWGWPREFRAEGGSRAMVYAGAVEVIDIAKAATDPAHAVVARVPAGGSPVRITLSADGSRVYVTARNSNAVIIFDAEKLRTDPKHAQIASVPVGTAPVALCLAQGDRTLLAGNSNRFGGGQGSRSTFTVVDLAAGDGKSPVVLGTVPSGGFPREFRVAPDGETVFLANFFSKTVQIFRLPARSP